MNCSRCDGTGFLNSEQITEEMWDKGLYHILDFISSKEADISICDCCGDGHGGYGDPGGHYRGENPKEAYAYNGGLPECN